MLLKEFATMLNGKECRYPIFTEQELQIAKDNGFVIVTGSSDDLVELNGAISDEGECFEGGKIYVHAIPDGKITQKSDSQDVFCFEAKWCQEKDERGNIIPWSYIVEREHEDFMLYIDGKPYCRGFVFKLDQIEELITENINVTLSIYFEIIGSQAFEGDAGYPDVKLDFHKKNFDYFELGEFIEEQKREYAKIFKIPMENIRVFLRKEYKENTEED